MARRNSREHLAPFPESISKSHFSSWVSGFLDGEACFHIGLQKRNNKYRQPNAGLHIGLRFDDRPILELIQQFFKAGHIYLNHYVSPKRNAYPCCLYHIDAVIDLVEIVIPHLDSFPLLSRKKTDYTIWREAVLFMHEVFPSRRIVKGKPRTHIWWTPEKIQKFSDFVDSMKKNRIPNHPSQNRKLEINEAVQSIKESHKLKINAMPTV